jgi:hypothetical protein
MSDIVLNISALDLVAGLALKATPRKTNSLYINEHGKV